MSLSKMKHQIWRDHLFSQRNKARKRAEGSGVCVCVSVSVSVSVSVCLCVEEVGWQKFVKGGVGKVGGRHNTGGLGTLCQL